ncbi:hypothetical protein CYMTET_22316 [Cymbomonas tetramitiformis]|uniref:EF-hand domain-containing protein n=1 Tax=Cymbomonas tetramitiformis TaxID=36881 RepID=A0AAE0G118_9CHLO|nr:hypothetical protein CYMTET_22316 [Cymbomonas tetramitiformis]
MGGCNSTRRDAASVTTDAPSAGDMSQNSSASRQDSGSKSSTGVQHSVSEPIRTKRKSVLKVMNIDSSGETVNDAAQQGSNVEQTHKTAVLGRKSRVAIRRASLLMAEKRRSPGLGVKEGQVETVIGREELEELLQDFKKCDRGTKGYLTQEDVGNMMQQEQGDYPLAEELELMMKFLDLDSDGQVTFNEYVSAVTASPIDESTDAARAKSRASRRCTASIISVRNVIDSKASNEEVGLPEPSVFTVETLETIEDLLSPIEPEESSESEEKLPVTEIDDEELAELKRDFIEMNLSGSGYLSRDEVKVMMYKESKGQKPTEEQVEKMFCWLDGNWGDGRINFEKYVIALTTSSPPG